MKKIINNKALKYIIRTIEALLFLIIALYLIFINFQRVSNNSSIMGYRLFTVATGSMTPVYNVHDVIIVKEVKEQDLKVGDDITYLGEKNEMKDKIVTHRITKIKDGKITTQGIVNPDPDPKITYNQVLGKVVGKLYLITFISKLVYNQYGFFFIIFVPLVIMIFLEFISAINDFKKPKEEEVIEDEEEVI